MTTDSARWPKVLLLAALLAGSASDAPAREAASARLRAPDTLDCPRDHLTSYAGHPLRYRRANGRTELRIRTDAETTEDISIAHAGSDDPSRWFRFAQRPFEPADWARIERRRGQLRGGLRVIAWVCDDGRNAIVDWRGPPAE